MPRILQSTIYRCILHCVILYIYVYTRAYKHNYNIYNICVLHMVFQVYILIAAHLACIIYMSKVKNSIWKLWLYLSITRNVISPLKWNGFHFNDSSSRYLIAGISKAKIRSWRVKSWILHKGINCKLSQEFHNSITCGLLRGALIILYEYYICTENEFRTPSFEYQGSVLYSSTREFSKAHVRELIRPTPKDGSHRTKGYKWIVMNM